MTKKRTTYVTDHYAHMQGGVQVGVVHTISTSKGVLIAEGVGLVDAEAIADLAEQVYLLNCLKCGTEMVFVRTDREPDAKCINCQLVDARGYVKMDAGKRAAIRATLSPKERAKPRAMTQHALDPAQAAALKGLLK